MCRRLQRQLGVRVHQAQCCAAAVYASISTLFASPFPIFSILVTLFLLTFRLSLVSATQFLQYFELYTRETQRCLRLSSCAPVRGDDSQFDCESAAGNITSFRILRGLTSKTSIFLEIVKKGISNLYRYFENQSGFELIPRLGHGGHRKPEILKK